MKKIKIHKSVWIAVLIGFLIASAAMLYVFSQLANHHYTQKRDFSLSIWQGKFPNAFSMIYEKFGDDLEVTDASPGALSITYKYSAEFENKYNLNGKPTEEFLQDIADEWFECFHDEIEDKLENHDEYFNWPVSISFSFEKGSEYERIAFSYEDFDKCNVIRHEKW
ncbi:MAG: hypothetical protein NC253_04070 [Ruminococcus sp.]|nr:hypothetical protein [Ruminococcus sp.]MCM1380948.1 hypothetical protein [Muribaculaceae bacterium]MCM1480165.1 hypothetical protein [Muribaculaceae bacterium]